MEEEENVAKGIVKSEQVIRYFNCGHSCRLPRNEIVTNESTIPCPISCQLL